MRRAAPFEFRLAGAARGEPWQVSVGELVPSAAAQALRALLCEPRYSLLHAQDPTRPPEPSLVQELQARGFHRPSVRLSVFIKGHGKPRRPRVLPVVPGSLLLRWGWLGYDHSPDLTASWAAPVERADMNLLLGLFSGIGAAAPERRTVAEHLRLAAPLPLLRSHGWDLRTLDFRARKLRQSRLDASAAPPAL